MTDDVSDHSRRKFFYFGAAALFASLTTSHAMAQSVSNKLSGPVDQTISLDIIDEQGHSRHVEFGRTALRGTLVRFGNLPETRLYFESRALAGGKTGDSRHPHAA